MSLLRKYKLLFLLCGLFPGPGYAVVPAVVPEQFLPQLTAQIAEHYRLSGELQLELLRNWTPPATPASAWQMQVVDLPATLVPQNIVRVRLVANEHSLGEWSLPLRVRLWADGLVTRQPVGRGAQLESGLFDVRRTDFLRDKDAVPADRPLAALTVSRNLSGGTLLAWRDLVPRPLVQKGETVDVVVSEGSLNITMKALALQSGALGETVLVRNPESHRDFSAVVTAENQIRVSF